MQLMAMRLRHRASGLSQEGSPSAELVQSLSTLSYETLDATKLPKAVMGLQLSPTVTSNPTAAGCENRWKASSAFMSSCGTGVLEMAGLTHSLHWTALDGAGGAVELVGGFSVLGKSGSLTTMQSGIAALLREPMTKIAESSTRSDLWSDEASGSEEEKARGGWWLMYGPIKSPCYVPRHYPDRPRSVNETKILGVRIEAEFTVSLLPISASENFSGCTPHEAKRMDIPLRRWKSATRRRGGNVEVMQLQPVGAQPQALWEASLISEAKSVGRSAVREDVFNLDLNGIHKRKKGSSAVDPGLIFNLGHREPSEMSGLHRAKRRHFSKRAFRIAASTEKQSFLCVGQSRGDDFRCVDAQEHHAPPPVSRRGAGGMVALKAWTGRGLETNYAAWVAGRS
ncbi:hypothetical protein FB45DRAFT_1086046 [Roridomyces roridus]|uniref:Uncharacterized protein n=1 Tax=Roridomyces roridus TaxID=1738132 RepID=A0AAD7FJZ0_9AGAR|nr:hypothetical protein FB45DRAFT_1086046 [Roridomyces roridus]